MIESFVDFIYKNSKELQLEKEESSEELWLKVGQTRVERLMNAWLSVSKPLLLLSQAMNRDVTIMKDLSLSWRRISSFRIVC